MFWFQVWTGSCHPCLSELEKFSAPVISREMQVKSTMRYYITPVKMTKNKSTNMLTRAWRDGAPYTVDGNVISIATLKNSRNVGSTISLSYDWATEQLQHWVHTLKKLNPTVMNASTPHVYYSIVHSTHKNGNTSDIYQMKSGKSLCIMKYSAIIMRKFSAFSLVCLFSFETGPHRNPGWPVTN